MGTKRRSELRKLGVPVATLNALDAQSIAAQTAALAAKKAAGEPVDDDGDDDDRECPECGQPIPAASTLCAHCGASLEPDDDAPAKPAPAKKPAKKKAASAAGEPRFEAPSIAALTGLAIPMGGEMSDETTAHVMSWAMRPRP
jgi:hypothetical protein